MGTLSRRISRSQLAERYDEAAKQAALSLKRKYPHLTAIMVQGSVARGELGPFSDIDLVGVTRTRKKPAEFSYFDQNIYIPVGFVSVADLEKEFKDPKQFFWARGSAKSSTRILYDPNRILRRIMHRWEKAEPSSKILEDSLREEYHHIIEYSGKLRNGWLRRDEYLTRYAARVIAQHVENVIIALNDLSPITENYVWDQVLKAKTKPKHFETDYPLALGLRGTRQTESVYRSAVRLCRETLLLVREKFGDDAKDPRFRALLEERL